MNQATAAIAKPGIILIADDSAEARRMLEVRVKREGHQSILVEDGRQALEVLRQQNIDVLLLDIDMPELDGFAVLRTVKSDPRLAHIPVLIISGGGEDDDLVRCIELGAVDFLPKPFNQAVLRARINSCLLQKRHRDHELKQAKSSGKDTDTGNNVTAEFQLTPNEAAAISGISDDRPQQLGRINIQQLLGSGAHGRVYLGHHALLDMQVAVKLVRRELTATPEARARLLREARLAVRLAHRHIVRLLEVNEAEAGFYVVFEYVSGGTLKEFLDRHPSRRLPFATAVRLTQEVASALAESSRLGITHRDIKPANLLLTPEGEIKVADFGLAKESGLAPDPNHQVSIEGAIVGTPLYMAPEQLAVNGASDVRTDFYALGCVLYEMLVGHSPLETLAGASGAADAPTITIHDILYHQLHTPPKPPTRFRHDIPTSLETICLKLLAKRPEDRFQTPDALLSALQTEA